MKVSSITNTPDAYRQSQFYAGTHLVAYKAANIEYSPSKSKQSFDRSFLQANNPLNGIKTPSAKEDDFLILKQKFEDREEALQRLVFQNGVNFTVDQQLKYRQHL